MNEKNKKILIKSAEFAAINGAQTYLRKKTYDKILPQVLVFAIGEITNYYYFAGRGSLLKITGDEVKDSFYQQFAFSSLLQVLANGIIYDDFGVIAEDLLNVILTYVVNWEG